MALPLTLDLLSSEAAPLDGTWEPPVICPFLPEVTWWVEGRSICHDAMGKELTLQSVERANTHCVLIHVTQQFLCMHSFNPHNNPVK